MAATQPSPLPSSHADQPPHMAGEPVDLACIDVTLKVSRSTPGAVEVGIVEVPLRKSAMDQYGVGYVTEMVVSRNFRRASLSRRDFGWDNCSIELGASVAHYSSVSGTDPMSAPVHQEYVDVKGACRAWVWAPDKAYAVERIKERFARALDQASRVVQQVAPHLERARLQECEPVVAGRKMRP